MQVGMAQASPASKDGIMLMHWVGLLTGRGRATPSAWRFLSAHLQSIIEFAVDLIWKLCTDAPPHLADRERSSQERHRYPDGAGGPLVRRL
jgi:hypothetical protein